jgi:hypothetical protein
MQDAIVPFDKKSLLRIAALQQDEVSNDMGPSHIAALANNTAPNDACELWIMRDQTASKVSPCPRRRHVNATVLKSCAG